VLHAELGVRLRLVRRACRALDRVDEPVGPAVGAHLRAHLPVRVCGVHVGARPRVHAFTRCLRMEVKMPRPSRLGAPVSSSTACSGCVMSPTIEPVSLVMPAMSFSEPFGLPR